MKENGGVSLTPYAGIKDEKAIVDLEEYARTTKACHVKLQVRIPTLLQRQAEAPGPTARMWDVV